MSRDDRRSVLRSVYVEANSRFRGFFVPDPDTTLLDRLTGPDIIRHGTAADGPNRRRASGWPPSSTRR